MTNFTVGRFSFLVLIGVVLALAHLSRSFPLGEGYDQVVGFGILTAFLLVVSARWRDARIHLLYLLLAPVPVLGQLVLFFMLIFKKRPVNYDS